MSSPYTSQLMSNRRGYELLYEGTHVTSFDSSGEAFLAEQVANAAYQKGVLDTLRELRIRQEEELNRLKKVIGET